MKFRLGFPIGSTQLAASLALLVFGGRLLRPCADGTRDLAGEGSDRVDRDDRPAPPAGASRDRASG